MIILCVILYIAYNFVVFDYSSHVYNTKASMMKTQVITSIINAFLLFAPIYIVELRNESIMMILHLVFYGLEIKYFFRQNILKVLFGLMAFCVNYFAFRFIILGTISLIYSVPIPNLLADTDGFIFISVINLAVRTPSILLTRKRFQREIIDLLFTSKKTLFFSCCIFCGIYINQFITSLAMNVTDFYQNMSAIQIRTGIFSVILFYLIMICIYVFSKLRMKALKYEEIYHEMEKESSIVEKLEAFADIDSFTGMYNHYVAKNQLDEYVKNNVKSFAAFIDIDGLKHTNDVYGHEEGNFYIKKVVNEIMTIFKADTISRMGGDEFLIVGKTDDFYDPINKVLLCTNRVKGIKNEYEKEYSTSISYGLVNIDTDNTMTADEIVKLADQKMYELKKSRKKERNIIEVAK